VTVQFPQIDAAEPRLYQDSYRPNDSDQSFAEKLQAEKDRLGLLFSPFSQLASILTTVDFFNAGFKVPATFQDIPELTNSQPPNHLSTQPPSTSTKSEVKLFESLPLTRNFSSQLLKDLLSKSGWLTPNLAGQTLFFQAFAAGQLLPKFDMQALIDEIVSRALLVKDKGRTELRLGLKPADLGEIMLTLTSHAGLVAIQIAALPESKKLLESNIEELKKALKKARINFDEITIKEVESHV